jgi:hypothetical protein
MGMNGESIGFLSDLLHYFFFGLAADSPVTIDPYISTGISLRHG